MKFKTIAELMLKMDYDASSPEMKSIALLWLESISGINLTHENSTSEARQRIAQYRATEREAAQLLVEAVTASHLNVDQIRTLLFAAGRPEVIAILENVRQLVMTAETAPVVQTAPPMPIAEGS